MEATPPPRCQTTRESSAYRGELVNYILSSTDSSLIFPHMYQYEIQDILFLEPPDKFDILQFVSFSSTNTRSAKLVHNFIRYSSSKHFYFNRIVRLWNALRTPSIESFNTIKYKLLNYLWQHFLTHFNLDNLCSYYYICPM